ncbi:DUF2569 domain-containing protein [Virgibacillus sp. MSJ-26]|uniref:DUF2569 family protein n=1 Tax=Virgibacillus sp. MSJ-26 TaxID=2841522 RepID=UPI001C126553|nr:DUF2569 family protein [Virgibacillus sp. MSJ-26]MBU5467312.1 DUF2569 domain-containing protein [Virgibacillus sp. MSJ-26]
MTEKNIKQDEPNFNTDSKYAIVSGWLILPAIHVFVSTFGSVLILLMANPVELDQVGLTTYIFSAVMLLFTAVVIYSWIKRKRFVPILMIIFYLVQAAESLLVYISGYAEEMFYLLVSVVLIVYFIRSKRVKATFTK